MSPFLSNNLIHIDSTLIDNSTEELSMRYWLSECISLPTFETLQIATGYWDLPGMALIVDELSRFLEREGTTLQLLIGKDPYVYASQLKNPKYKDAKYPYDFIKTDIHELELREEYERVVALLLKYCPLGKIQIRIFRKNEEDETQFLHSKCYLFLGKTNCFGIIGSSNFTKKGLEGNAELNYLETDSKRVTAVPCYGSPSKGHKIWFEEKWEISEEWTETFLEQILKRSPIGGKVDPIVHPHPQEEIFTPYELYIKLLQTKFGDVIDRSLTEEIESYLPEEIIRLDYQIEAVKRCLSIMREHGGFMLADVVGLGKTIVGTLIIKRFLSDLRDDGRERKVLVITPPAIKAGWERTIDLFDQKDNTDKILPFVDFITTGKIGSLLDDEEEVEEDMEYLLDEETTDGDQALQDIDYGLIIIDESHRFRRSTTKMYQSLDTLIENIGARSGAYPYIGLLSATPQNNKPDDLKNQIYLFERNHKDSTLKRASGGDLEDFFGRVNKEYNALLKGHDDLSDEERAAKLKEISQELRDCILEDLLERRTRTDVKTYYKADIEAQRLTFPELVGPHALVYRMDDELARLFADTMSIIAPSEVEKIRSDEWLRYYRYRAIEYFVDPANEQKHMARGNRGVGDIAGQLATIMQIMLVKRLESSFTAFKRSLLNLRRYTDNMIQMWERDTIFICPQIDINQELDNRAKSERRGRIVTYEDCVQEIREKIKKLTLEGRNERGQNAEYRKSDFRPEYYDCLKRDSALISLLCDRWGATNSQDPKFDTFKESIDTKLFDPKTNTSGKLVIFSEAKDTVNSLSHALAYKGHRALVITAANRDEKEQVIRENFDANYTGEWRDEYDVIITTDVLAEGVNLHRANVILNYDTPWNSTRLMQRIGRVNRIGSQHPKIYVYNFMPSAQGDEMIQLVQIAHSKLQSFHVLFGGDSKIFTDDESLIHYDNIRVAIDGEESPLQKYVYELKQYRDSHPDRYQLIAETDEGWEMAQDAEGSAYFVVRAPKSAPLAIEVEQDPSVDTKILSLLDLLERLQALPEDTRVPLPEDWPSLRKRAIYAYNQHYVRILKSHVGQSTIDKALGIIVKIGRNPGSSEEIQQLLQSARKQVDRGNRDVIRRMIQIGDEMSRRESQLIPVSIDEIETLLRNSIGKLIKKVETQQGTPGIVLGIIK